MLDQRFSQKQLQKLSPQQIQLMKLLQIPTANLEQRVQEELESNPALEEVKDSADDELYENSDDEIESSEEEKEIEDYAADDSEEEAPLEYEQSTELDDYIEDYLDDEDAIASYKLQANNYSADDEEKTVPLSVEESYNEYLDEQLGQLDLDERGIKIARQIIGSIDDDGYLRREVYSIVDDLAFSQGIDTTEEEVERLLKDIQTFDPPGTGARDLRECLIIQLERKKETSNDIPKDVIETALRIITNHFEEFSKKHYEKLQKYLAIDEDELKDSMDIILKLNPKPASGYTSGGKSRGSIHYIMPDFSINNNGNGDLELILNSRNAPDLRVSEQYKEMLRAYVENNNRTTKDREAVMFIKQKIEAARWFIDAILQRQNTMYNTMYAILQYQKDFFLTGDQKKIKPMILKDIADITKMDISTVSRVANSKYVQTEFGTRRLKDFFSESIQTESGEEVSTLEVKKILTEIIESENKRKPISDEVLRNILMERGYNIARRTIAKYREQLGISVARLRKEL